MLINSESNKPIPELISSMENSSILISKLTKDQLLSLKDKFIYIATTLMLRFSTDNEFLRLKSKSPYILIILKKINKMEFIDKNFSLMIE